MKKVVLLLIYNSIFVARTTIIAAQELVGDVDISVEKISSESSSLAVILGLAVLFLIVLAVVIVLLRHLVLLWKSQSPRSTPEKIVKEIPVASLHEANEQPSFSLADVPFDDDAERYLKEEEKLIYKILKSREGQCEQGTLLVITQFSKAYLSRLLSEMETRGIIEIFQNGRINLIRL
ncbi:hypothetical protein HYS47_00730, partial [Candidatus Woesearchaeota archaeon]|nr:hypothetical protein [Candidatus Woesearchaeota archaeon]